MVRSTTMIQREIEERDKKEIREKIKLLERKTENVSPTTTSAWLGFLQLFSQYQENGNVPNQDVNRQVAVDIPDEQEEADEQQHPLVQANEENRNVPNHNVNLQVTVEIPEQEAVVQENEENRYLDVNRQVGIPNKQAAVPANEDQMQKLDRSKAKLTTSFHQLGWNFFIYSLNTRKLNIRITIVDVEEVDLVQADEINHVNGQVAILIPAEQEVDEEEANLVQADEINHVNGQVAILIPAEQEADEHQDQEVEGNRNNNANGQVALLTDEQEALAQEVENPNHDENIPNEAGGAIIQVNENQVVGVVGNVINLFRYLIECFEKWKKIFMNKLVRLIYKN
uniref:Uncharacterized protein n=1 Tax=Acrobeloides nanus TaxID=290746 RepID=A0A914DSJ6_9BILA